jgi:DNA-directed RNA polymerase specialized sigma24 family protein
LKSTLLGINIDELRFSESKRAELCRSLYLDVDLKTGIKSYVKSHGGSEDDNDEIFQDSIVQFFKRLITDQNFTLQSDVKAYIFGIAKNIFHSKMKIAGRNIELDLRHEVESAEANAISKLIDQDKLILYNQILTKSTETCRQVLMLWANSYKMEEIAEKMEYKSEMMARKKKYECLQKLIEYFKSYPNVVNQILEDGI